MALMSAVEVFIDKGEGALRARRTTNERGRKMAEINAGETSARVLRYPGSKWALARQIVGMMPEHERYLEPFFGSGAVLFAKPPAAFESVNDLDADVVNLFSLFRDDRDLTRLVEAVTFTPYAEAELRSVRGATDADEPVERARRFLVRSWMDLAGLRPHGDSTTFRFSGPGTHRERVAHVWAKLPERIAAAARRMKDVQFFESDAVGVIEAHRDPRVLIYADPPTCTPRARRSATTHTRFRTRGTSGSWGRSSLTRGRSWSPGTPPRSTTTRWRAGSATSCWGAGRG